MRNTYLQFAQFVSGGIIAVLLGIHVVVLHLDEILGFFGSEVVDVTAWEAMIERSGKGLWVGIYIALLIFGLYHGLNGLRNIILELTPSVRVSRVITWVFIIIGIAAFIMGTYVPVLLFSM